MRGKSLLKEVFSFLGKFIVLRMKVSISLVSCPIEGMRFSMESSIVILYFGFMVGV